MTPFFAVIKLPASPVKLSTQVKMVVRLLILRLANVSIVMLNLRSFGRSSLLSIAAKLCLSLLDRPHTKVGMECGSCCEALFLVWKVVAAAEDTLG